jgi:hypothetical protein
MTAKQNGMKATYLNRRLVGATKEEAEIRTGEWMKGGMCTHSPFSQHR